MSLDRPATLAPRAVRSQVLFRHAGMFAAGGRNPWEGNLSVDHRRHPAVDASNSSVYYL